MRLIPPAVRQLLQSRSLIGADAPRTVITFVRRADGTPISPPITVQVSNLHIRREAAALAQSCSLQWPNVNPGDHTDVGYYSPDRSAPDFTPTMWQGVVMPGAEFTVDMGYGSRLVRSFTGCVDDVRLHSDPDDYHIALEARDMGWRLVDLSVDDGSKTYRVTYTAQPVEAIVHDLLEKAGWTPADIITEPTGIIVSISFDGVTYADAVERLSELTGFELTVDEYGKAYWLYPTDRQPVAPGEAVTLWGATPAVLQNKPVVASSELVTDVTGTVTYARGTDYAIMYKQGTIQRVAGGSIPSGETVSVNYVYAAWSFCEGQDIFRLDYTISRRNVYGTIRVQGAEVDPQQHHSGAFTFHGSSAYGIPETKVLFTNVHELDSDASCQAAANQMGNDMVRKVRQVLFAAVAMPWIQIGDCVQVVETASTISEIYRLTDLEFELSNDGFIMTGTAYHYGYAPL